MVHLSFIPDTPFINRDFIALPRVTWTNMKIRTLYEVI